MFKWLVKLINKFFGDPTPKLPPVAVKVEDQTIKPPKEPHVETEVNVEDDRDNIDIEEDAELEDVFWDNNIDKEDLWYPKAEKALKGKMRTRGRYKNKYPKGAVVHYTAGRSRNKEEGGPRQQETHYKQGLKSVESAIKRDSYAYFIIARDGTVFQNFPLDRYGYHAGKSKWVGLGSSVSSKLVGIEIQNAGRLKDYWKDGRDKKHKCPEGYLSAWFSRPDKGDKLFNKATECRYSGDNDNIQKGWYHKYSPEQIKALKQLLLWLKANNPDVFQLKYVLGHDEVAGEKGIGYNRKNDPGAALPYSMSDFREELKSEYRKYIS